MGILGTATSIIPSINNYNEQKSNLNYRTALALKNMEDSKNQAYAQKQLGIEEARKQKIAGIKEANDIMTQNASGGLNVFSGNNFYNYEDTIENAYSNAKSTQNSYDVRADNYFENAKSYLNEAKSYKKQKKSLGWNLAATALGQTNTVAKKWFTTGSII